MNSLQASMSPAPGADREEPELANEEDIPSDDDPAAPKPAPEDPEKGRVPTPDPVKPEHPRQ
jgi:hypothetical protein